MLIIFLLLPLQANSKDYVVPPHATDVGIQRVNDLSFRYVIFGFDACFRVELLSLSGINKRVLVQKDICSYKGKNFATDFSYVGFQDIKVANSRFIFNLNTMALRGLDEYDQQCIISIHGTKNSINGAENAPSLSDMTCTEPVVRDD